jgi:cyclophilin family peptidyl-prolyl cis-trans isomerase
MAENDADATVVTVSRTAPDVSQDLLVTLTANPAVLTLPATVTIPAGSPSTTFSVRPLDDELASGNKSVSINAAASEYTSGTLVMTVVDNESPRLSLSPIQRALTEGSTDTAIFTVSRNTADLSTPLSVTVSSSSSRISFPLTVVIPSGATESSFSVAALDDSLVSLSNSVTIQTSTDGFFGAQSTVTITENDLYSLSIDPVSLSANELSGQVAAAVSLGQPADGNVTVNLSYSSPDLLTGPATITIPAGQQSAEVLLSVIRGSVPEGQRTGSVTASITGTTASDTASIVVQDADSFGLTTDVSSNEVVSSSDILITRSSSFLISGATAPLASLSVDSDGDGQFDDASGIANASGSYSVTVPLTAGGPDQGDYHMVIRAVTTTGVADTVINVHFATGTLMRFETSAGTYDVELLDAEAPVTVANFLSYQSSSRYNNLIVHRNVSDFVVQGGGFTVSNGNVSAVQTNPPIQNEFLATNSNVRGTLAMAMVSGNINSGTSQWFVNVVDNTFLDAGKYTVFGRVIGSGMTVVDAINKMSTYNISSVYGNGALAEVPLFNPPPAGTQLSGTVSLQTGSTTLTGIGTAFSTQLTPGQSIWISGKTYHVQSIQSNVSAVLVEAATTAVTNSAAWTDFLSEDADFVVFSSIQELLPLLP